MSNANSQLCECRSHVKPLPLSIVRSTLAAALENIMVQVCLVRSDLKPHMSIQEDQTALDLMYKLDESCELFRDQIGTMLKALKEQDELYLGTAPEKKFRGKDPVIRYTGLFKLGDG
jgi:hypothetical protein